MGHRVTLLDFDYDDFFSHAESAKWLEESRGKFSEALWQAFSNENVRERFDFAFFYICDGFIDPEVIRSIRKEMVPIFNYSCNNIHQFHLVDKISRLIDCNVFAEEGAAEKFAAIGVPAVQMQMAADPAFYTPNGAEYRYNVSFVGQRYANRGALISRLVRSGIEVDVFGPRWQSNGETVGNASLSERIDKLVTMVRETGLRSAALFALGKVGKKLIDLREDRLISSNSHGILTDEAMVCVFAESRINLGFANVYRNGNEWSAPMSHLRLRDFEVPMTGGFYLTQYTEEIERYFKVGLEIECYKSDDELIDKCRYYLRHPSEREKIRRAGLARSLACHTWEHRFTKLLSEPTITSLLDR
jgi:spore maturation protein CgeB